MSGERLSSVDRSSLFLEAAELQRRAPDSYAAADAVHGSLPAEFWGISLEQVVGFMDLVRGAIGSGALANEAAAYPEDHPHHYPQAVFEKSGPDMYAVNARVIRPQTRSADATYGVAGLSYAVMLNTPSQGLRCDLFISHAWAEPAFEFEASLKGAWPPGCRAAYFCCLSNPQNLDISKLCADPETSPFFRVLDGCRPTVLMVPNSRVAIHSRMWCCYEAFVAHTMGLGIRVAGSRAQLVMDREADRRASEEARKNDDILMDLDPCLYRWYGFCCCPCISCAMCYEACQASRLCLLRKGDLERAEHARRIGCWDAAVACALLATCDCCRRVSVLEGGVRRTYGDFDKNAAAFRSAAIDIRRAGCSSEDDRRRIMAAIRGREDAVNSMIRALVYSSPTHG